MLYMPLSTLFIAEEDSKLTAEEFPNVYMGLLGKH